MTASFKIGVSKVQDFGNFELSPMHKASEATITDHRTLNIHKTKIKQPALSSSAR